MIFPENQNDFFSLLGRDSDDLLFGREQQATLNDLIFPQLISEEERGGTYYLREETKNRWGEDWSSVLAEYSTRDQEDISVDQIVDNMIEEMKIKFQQVSLLYFPITNGFRVILKSLQIELPL